MQRKISLTDIDKKILSSFLIDEKMNSHKSKADDSCKRKEVDVKGSLTTDMLMEDPFVRAKENTNNRNGQRIGKESRLQNTEKYACTRHSNAREVVMVPSRFKRLSVLLGKHITREGKQKEMSSNNRSHSKENIKHEEREERSNRWSDLSTKTDKHVSTSASSWDYNEGGYEHYDTWDVLRDEYAQDFGYNFTRNENSDSDEDADEHFAILGTSQDDSSSTPHVLSPPIMSSLLNFIPVKLSGENYWLKYSLLRDGASLETLYRYIKAATNTIVAIQTTDGDTFGSFTASPWRITKGYFGSGESFLWKLRRNRNTPCHSLFDQAHLESEIDVFPFSSLNSCVQLCTEKAFGAGCGEMSNKDTQNSDDDYPSTSTNDIKQVACGFGFALQSNLQYGTTSPCATFCNPSLIHDGSVFEVGNLEVWTFTPFYTVDEAEKLEMKLYFLEGLQSPTGTNSSISSRSNTGRYSHSTKQNSLPQGFFSRENQEAFYRRMGQEQWHDYQRKSTF